MSRDLVPPQERGIEYERSEDSSTECAYWACAPQHLLDYVSEHLRNSQTLAQRPGGVTPARVAEDVRLAGTAWIGRMTTFSLRTVVELLRGADIRPDSGSLEPRVAELIAASRGLLRGLGEVASAPHRDRLERAVKAFDPEFSLLHTEESL